ncbi:MULTISPECIES: VOC family protein [Mycolicibacterium]|jgi:glyoxylase I family protein|uniref:Glyoxalase n=3 Tax=Mycolicibacterium TaxID=1866885 RepID=A0A378SXP6_9MYCO|nr:MULTISPECIES: VOC family protein [Mycolicibacterium]KLI05522.1 glyoxalase [Mycolicibacterium senegalense]KLO54376.1 glyoxalase [Mycolicibacterium senegalense]KMV16068.1 glyoxalase [Mycolicibacterium conceptionense]MCV7335250.1 VOC family protein [Mycolicibacterium senegalense]MDR7289205.1 glyoxylase I family protein [Mycolicibacterium senegalense]
MAITTSSVAHVRLTVTDIERSRQFYESVFGWPVLIELPQDAEPAVRARLSFLSGGVIYDAGATLVGLRPVGRDAFDENRTGLDHLAFRLKNIAELDDAAAHLDGLGIAHEPVKDIGPSFILEFRDPDNIALELTAPK